MKRLIKITIGVIIILTLLIVRSPFKLQSTNYYVLESEISIPSIFVEEAFQYLGNSTNASKWSVFVDHITHLNTADFLDGTVGSKRRCFKNANEEGLYWDEEIIKVESNKSRTLTIYNFNDFPVQLEGLTTRQMYVPSKSGCTILLGLYKFNEKLSFMDVMKMKLVGYYIKHIFNKNLKGIKKQLVK